MHVYRILSASVRAILAATALAVAVSFAGCKKSTPPPDDAALSSAVQSRIAGDSALQAEPIQVFGPERRRHPQRHRQQRSRPLARRLRRRPGRGPQDRGQQSHRPAARAAARAAAACHRPRPRRQPVRKATKSRARPAKARADASITRPPSSAFRRRRNPRPVAPPPPPPPPPAAPAFRDVTVPAGTTLPIRITQTLDSATTQQGDSFSGTVATDIIIDGLVVIPQGATVSGRVDAVQEAAHFKGNSLLTIELTGSIAAVKACPVTTEPYSVAGKGRGKNTAEKVGGGAAVGAILGGIFGGGKGAAIGAAAGGGLGAGANAVTRGEQVQIPSESLIRFHLTNALALRVSTSDTRSTPNNPNLQQRPDYQPPQ